MGDIGFAVVVLLLIVLAPIWLLRGAARRLKKRMEGRAPVEPRSTTVVLDTTPAHPAGTRLQHIRTHEGGRIRLGYAQDDAAPHGCYGGHGHGHGDADGV